MNIDSIRNYNMDLRKSRLKHSKQISQSGDSSVQIRDSINITRNNGSFVTFNGAAVSLTDKAIISLSKFCNEHTSITQSLFALALATTLRPLAILYMPGQKKNKKDKEYAAIQGISTGTVGFGFSYLIMSPLDSAAKKARKMVQGIKDAPNEILDSLKSIFKVNNAQDLLSNEEYKNFEQLINDITSGKVKEVSDVELKRIKKLFNVDQIEELAQSKRTSKVLNTFKKVKEGKFGNLPELTPQQLARIKEIFKVENLADLANSPAFEKVSKIMDMHIDTLFLGVGKAMLTVALIPPLLKLFGMTKSNKSDNNPQILAQKVTIPHFGIKEFAGGLK